MKLTPTEEFLLCLTSKRKQLRVGARVFSRLDISSAERKRLYEIAKEHELLIEYQFSGTED